MKHMLIMVFILISLIVIANKFKLINNEIKESRMREDLLLQEVKLLDYQINVLTNTVLQNN